MVQTKDAWALIVVSNSELKTVTVFDNATSFLEMVKSSMNKESNFTGQV